MNGTVILPLPGRTWKCANGKWHETYVAAAAVNLASLLSGDNADGRDADTGEVADDAETDAAIEREAARLSGQGDDFGEDEEPDSTAMIVKQIIDELAARKTVPDINSLMATDSIRSVMSDIGDDAAAQIEAAKNARIAGIQNGGN